VLDVATGDPLVYCGNVRFDAKASGNQVDIIRAPRSTGSILKPFLYNALLEEGAMLPHTLLPDIPININGFSPQNFNRQFDGAVPASHALARSLNVPAVQMLRMYGLPKFHDLLKKAGMSTLTKSANHYGLSLILGGAEGTLWDIASIYRDMAKTLSAATWQTFEVLKEVNRPEEIDWRTIPSIQRIAWKTGTSYGFRDAWAVGVTPKYVVGVWVGNANGEGKPGLVGAKTAGPILFDLFNLLPSSPWFSPPEQLMEAEVCRQSGHLKGRFCTDIDTLLIVPEGFRSDPCPYHVMATLTPDERYRVYANNPNHTQVVTKSFFVLPPVWAWYYKQRHPLYESLPPYFPGSVVGDDDVPMYFIYPAPGAVISLPKQLDGSHGSASFRLAHNEQGTTVYWHLNQQYLTSTRDFHEISLSLEPGAYTLTVVDDTGSACTIYFFVK
jgi:penicillin-binding protein 1C